ncbi:hypothetical protein AVEN_220645-1 [Araneus ventricosus]|uniref:Uncharacterized protein n=1 Tax=Araneus ventricosus TaxID=182803 RepID=A0A4Y2NJA8_ARAVE|nr:hypothetical protein AVEN_2489-1 [Araneus ventricosus]GBN38666.1 hypothetical protein AVEN_233972-1 [Araneus ventricosus]GBN38766.1 hypothetical protein AVEN_150427-1 [Araneus ventricosus]GBN38806.1 hypothetical protein AVEN_220645-1 [Araneus ventricosus]
MQDSISSKPLKRNNSSYATEEMYLQKIKLAIEILDKALRKVKTMLRISEPLKHNEKWYLLRFYSHSRGYILKFLPRYADCCKIVKNQSAWSDILKIHPVDSWDQTVCVTIRCT